MNKEKIKAKISALLSKTVENGASEAEAAIALKKAYELMHEYYISESELSDLFAYERCTLEQVLRVKSAYPVDAFCFNLAKTFDCFSFFNHKYQSFFGMEQDAKLCCFFYSHIIRSALTEKDKYLVSSIARDKIKLGYSAKKVASSFIAGFVVRISERLDEMYENRNSTIPEGMGLVLVKKVEKVKKEYDALDFNVRAGRKRKRTVLESCFDDGCMEGDSFSISKGLKDHQTSTMLALN